MSTLSPFQLKKSLHINLTKSTHAELRIILFKKCLSMQEVLESLAVKIVDGDEYLNNILDELEYNKKMRIPVKKVNSTDIESIFEAIEDHNPLGESEDV
jgi:hypothetical protein